MKQFVSLKARLFDLGKFRICRAAYEVKYASHPTEPANYTSSYATGSKEIVDVEIGMCQGAEQSDTTAE